MKKILYLVGVDGSDFSHRAVAKAVGLAKKVEAIVHLVAIVKWSKYKLLHMTDIDIPPENAEKEEAIERKELLQPLLDKYADSGVKMTTSFKWGDPADELKKETKHSKANMIFVGRRGGSATLDLLMGSVASKLAHNIGVPIVLVP